MLFLALALRADYTTDLSAFLPAAPTENQQLLVDQLRSGPVSHLLLMGIESSGPPKAGERVDELAGERAGEQAAERTAERAGEQATDPAGERARLSRELVTALRGQPGIGAITNGAAADGDDASQKLIFDYRYLLGDATEAGRLAMPGLATALRDGLDTLASPLGLVYREIFTRDPTTETLRLVDRMQPAQTPRVIDGAWASDDGRRAIVLVRLEADGTALDSQQAALELIRSRFDQLRGETAARLVMTGTARFAVESRARIEADVHRLSLLGALVIIVLLLSVYRSPRLLALGLAPVLTGALAAVAMVSMVFGQVHAVTLGFGIALMAEALDYAIYLFVQGSSPALWRTVRLGVLTSLIGFATLVSSSFPGLAQLGVFAVTGLLVAALVSRFLLAPLVAAQPVTTPAWLGALARQLPRLRRLKAVPLIALACSLAVVTGISASRPLWEASLESLSPVPAADQALDQELRSSLRAPDIRHVIAARAADEGAALSLAEAIGERLTPLITAGQLGGFQSPATVLAPPARQRERQAALPDRDRLLARVAEATQGLPIRAERLAPFIDDVVASHDLKPLAMADLGASDLSLAVTSLMVGSSQGFTAMLPLQADPDGELDVARIRESLFQTSPSLARSALGSVHLLDIKAETDDLYGAYLSEALTMAGIGALLIVAVLALALARPPRGWAGRLRAVLLPLVAAELLVIATLAAAGIALTILHLVGLLLTLAVGSNYTLFFAERHDDERVLSSLLLANLTTAIGFGVLGLSQAPVLAAIGQTVGPGAILSLVFAAMASEGPRR